VVEVIADPSELVNLAAVNPQIVAEMTKKLATWRARPTVERQLVQY
jgi:hypothetical protein